MKKHYAIERKKCQLLNFSHFHFKINKTQVFVTRYITFPLLYLTIAFYPFYPMTGFYSISHFTTRAIFCLHRQDFHQTRLYEQDDRCVLRYKICLPFASTKVHLLFWWDLCCSSFWFSVFFYFLFCLSLFCVLYPILSVFVD
jgi:hypothetical protein